MNSTANPSINQSGITNSSNPDTHSVSRPESASSRSHLSVKKAIHVESSQPIDVSEPSELSRNSSDPLSSLGSSTVNATTRIPMISNRSIFTPKRVPQTSHPTSAFKSVALASNQDKTETKTIDSIHDLDLLVDEKLIESYPKISDEVFKKMQKSSSAHVAAVKQKWPWPNVTPKTAIASMMSHFLREATLLLSFIPLKSETTPPPIGIYFARHDVETDKAAPHGNNAFVDEIFKKAGKSKSLTNKYATSSTWLLRSPVIDDELPAVDGLKKKPVNLKGGTIFIGTCSGWKEELTAKDIQELIDETEDAEVSHYVVVLAQFNDFTKTPAELEKLRPIHYKNSKDALNASPLASNPKVTILTMDEWMNMATIAKNPNFKKKFPNIPSWITIPRFENTKSDIVKLTNNEADTHKAMILATNKDITRKMGNEKTSPTLKPTPVIVTEEASSQARPQTGSPVEQYQTTLTYVLPVVKDSVAKMAEQFYKDGDNGLRFGEFLSNMMIGVHLGILKNTQRTAPPIGTHEQIKQALSVLPFHDNNPNKKVESSSIPDEKDPTIQTTLHKVTSSVDLGTGAGGISKSQLNHYTLYQSRSNTTSPAQQPKSPSPILQDMADAITPENITRFGISGRPGSLG